MEPAQREVLIERSVNQVHDGTRYKGYVEIGGVRFDYEVVFTTSIPQIEAKAPPEDLKELRRLIPITLKKGEAEIELTEMEYGFFFTLLVMFAVGFYHNSQTRKTNDVLQKQSARNGDAPTAVGTFLPFCMTGNGRFGLTPEVCEALSAPKFGCQLTT